MPRILGGQQLLPRALRQTARVRQRSPASMPAIQKRGHREAGQRVADRRVHRGGRKVGHLTRRDGHVRQRRAALVEGP